MQTLHEDSKLLRIFIGESDKSGHRPLYEAILFKAKENGLAGATVIKGILSYGASSVLHTSKLIDISTDLPIIIEIIDSEEKIKSFVAIADKMLEDTGCGGLITIEKIDVLHYKPKIK